MKYRYGVSNMKKNFIKKLWRKSTLSLLMVLIYLISLTYTSGVYALTGTDPLSIDYWDGKDDYSSLAAVLAELGETDSRGYYHIKTANQLHAVIRFGGGENKYMLDNDLYLNENYQNYKNWNFDNPPANNWGLSGTGYSFSGTIDGDGHTIYGYFNKGASVSYVGLIPIVNWNTGDTQNVTIKNLHMENAVQQGNTASGFFIGATHWSGRGSVTIEGCSVRNSNLHMIWGGNYAGTFVGTVSNNSPVIIRNCAASDIEFDIRENHSVLGYATIGSFVGSSYCNTNSKYTFNGDQARAVKIYNSYAVNCINKKTNKPVYVCGILREGNGSLYSYCMTASNVYTDATEIPTNVAGTVKLLVTEDGTSAVAPESEAYPIKTVTADGIKGDSAKTAMPSLDWEQWKTAENGYPYFVPKAPPVIWDGKDDYANLDAVLAELGAADSDGYYHIKTANQLHAVIRLGGGDNKYKLDNDLYLNDGWDYYSSWTFDTPAPNDWGLSGTGYSFSGTIDGAGHTIYGYFNKAGDDKTTPTPGQYVGLIPVVNWNKGDTQNVTIKNLHMENAVQQGNTASGLFIGATHYVGEGSVTIEGCSVRNSVMHLIWGDTHQVGAFVGTASNKTPVVIKNCAVTDVIFDARAYGSVMGYSTLGSFVGSTYCNTNSNYTFNAAQAAAVKIYDSYAVNCINKHANKPVYICGILREGYGSLYSYCVTASNVYTDATEIPTNVKGDVKLLVTEDGNTEVAPANPAYPIRTIAADEIKGDDAKTAMPLFEWCEWSTVAKDYPVPEKKHALQLEQGTPASCNVGGTEDYWRCIECKKMFGDDKGENEISSVGTLEPINHKNAEHYTEKQVSCTENGNIEYWYCPDCKKYSTNADFTAICEQSVVIIPKTNHKGGKMHYTEISASCEEDGHIEYWHCTDCDKYYTDEACTNEVSKEAVITEIATGHKNPVYRSATAAGNSCLEPGTIAHYECLDCNKYFEDEACKKELISIEAPTDKHASQKISQKLPTCYKTGMKEHFECIYCHKCFEDEECKNQVTVSSLTIPEINHSNAKYNPQTASGCITLGLKEHWHCPDCDGYFVKSDLSDANKVDYSDLIIEAHGHITSEETVIDYDDEKHWQLCDVCGIEINHKAHKLAAPVSVYGGVERICECGYSLKKVNINLNRVNISADYGVFDAEATLNVERITSGTKYEKALTAIGEKVDAMKVYDVSASKGLLKVLPSGKVKITLPVSKSYSGNVAIYFIDENGVAKKLNAEIKRTKEVANLDLYGLGTFAVADLGVTSDMLITGNNSGEGVQNNDDASIESNTNSEIPNTGDTSKILIFIVTTVVAGFILITSRTVLKISKLKSRKEN